MTVLYIALAILLFGVLVGVHELGHFAAAKACGVRVEEFALGMGPAILQKQKGAGPFCGRQALRREGQ